MPASVGLLPVLAVSFPIAELTFASLSLPNEFPEAVYGTLYA